MSLHKRDQEIEAIWTDKKRTLFGLPLSFTRYYLTDTRLITRSGFLNVTEDEIEIYRITDKKLELPFWQRLFGCGTIIIYSRDVDTPVKAIKSVRYPRKISNLIGECVSEQRDRFSIRGRDMVGVAGEDL
ncbi:MAG: PH domain-containing protein [Ruminococcus sp.]|nr:PH domain-containing protein [Ruminococcus sp.]